MAIIARAFDDTLLDILKAELEAFSAEQAAQDPEAAFYIEREMTRAVPASKLPLVIVYVDSITPDQSMSGARIHCHETALISCDLIVKGMEKTGATGVDPVASDQVAMRRLAYLKEQVRYALYSLVNADFGLGPGIIATKKWPRWTLFPERTLPIEDQYADGRWQFEIEYEWTPSDAQTTALADLYIIARPKEFSPVFGIQKQYGT